MNAAAGGNFTRRDFGAAPLQVNATRAENPDPAG